MTVKPLRAVVESKPAEAAAAVKHAVSTADKAASKGVIPKKRAARIKSRLAPALHQATKAAPA